MSVEDFAHRLGGTKFNNRDVPEICSSMACKVYVREKRFGFSWGLGSRDLNSRDFNKIYFSLSRERNGNMIFF